MSPAPLFTDTMTLSTWLLGHFGDDQRVLPQRLCNLVLDLSTSLTLALKHRRREENLDLADEYLVTLRIQLRLVGATELLTPRQVLHALELADRIGRQLGGWQKQLDRAS